MVQWAVQKDATKVLQISQRQRSAMANIVHGGSWVEIWQTAAY